MIPRLPLALVLSLVGASTLPAQPARDADASAILRRGIERMGGEAALRNIQSVRIDMMTQWKRPAFTDHPSADLPSYERNVELRDYATRSWRNSRSFLTSPNGLTVVVRDTVAAIWSPRPGGEIVGAPLNVAYVDERRQLFTFAPERLLLLALDAMQLRSAGDSVIGGLRHARIAATLEGIPATLFVRNSDGLPAMVRFRANEDNDFGLAPWGEMEVEFWYSNWSRVQPGVLLPRQRDVRRFGKAYKRMTVLTFAVNAPAPADSFAISDSLAAAYLATQRRAMWDVPLDTVQVVEPGFVSFPLQMGAFGAVRIGGRWVMLETGQSVGAARKLERWVTKTTPNVPIGAAIVSTTSGNGGVPRFAESAVQVYAAPGAAPLLASIPGAMDRRPTRPYMVASARWVKVGTDSLWLEPVDTPNQAGLMAVYSPTQRWLYAPAILANPATAPEQAALIERLAARGLPVEWLGTARAIRVPVPR